MTTLYNKYVPAEKPATPTESEVNKRIVDFALDEMKKENPNHDMFYWNKDNGERFIRKLSKNHVSASTIEHIRWIMSLS